MAKSTAATGGKAPQDDTQTQAAGPAELVTKLVPIDSVKLDPKNAREHNDRSIATLCSTLKRFGQQKPIVVDRDNVIRAGNGTWAAAKKLCWPKINVVFTDLPAKEATLYAVADNRVGDLSYFDDDMLSESIDGASDEDLLSIGFDDGDKSDMFDERAPAAATPSRHDGFTNFNGKTASVRILIAVKNTDKVERALALTGQANREQALLEICEAYLHAAGDLDVE